MSYEMLNNATSGQHVFFANRKLCCFVDYLHNKSTFSTSNDLCLDSNVEPALRRCVSAHGDRWSRKGKTKWGRWMSEETTRPSPENSNRTQRWRTNNQWGFIQWFTLRNNKRNNQTRLCGPLWSTRLRVSSVNRLKLQYRHITCVSDFHS